MSGKTLVLEPGQKLFNKGDKSDGMYLVRSGELVVFFEENGKEIILTEVKSGGMIGEMALFDAKPRSAWVKAVNRSELTQISQEDFNKLIKQIPKWFTALMVTLSSRLRGTNERLQVLERQVGDASKINNLPKILAIFDILLHKEGAKQEKEGAKAEKAEKTEKNEKELETKSEKEWVVPKKAVLENFSKWFLEDPAAVEKIFKTLAELNYLQIKGKEDTQSIVVASRGILLNLITFLNVYLLQEKKSVLTKTLVDILSVASALGSESAYDTVTITATELQNYALKHKFEGTSQWQTAIEELKDIHRELQIIPTSDGLPGIRATKKDLKLFSEYHLALYKLSKALLS